MKMLTKICAAIAVLTLLTVNYALAQEKPSKTLTNLVFTVTDKSPHQISGAYCTMLVTYAGTSSDCLEVGGSNMNPDAGLHGALIGSCTTANGTSAYFKASDGAVWYRSTTATGGSPIVFTAVAGSNCQ